MCGKLFILHNLKNKFVVWKEVSVIRKIMNLVIKLDPLVGTFDALDCSLCHDKTRPRRTVSWIVPALDAGIGCCNKLKSYTLRSLPDRNLKSMTYKVRESSEHKISGGVQTQRINEDRKPLNLKEREERLTEAVDRLDQLGTQPNIQNYASLLRQCADAKNLAEGKRLHAHIMNSGCGCNRFLGNLLVHMYSNCGSLEDAHAVFVSIKSPNTFSGNIMIVAFTRNGYLENARRVFDKMPQRDVVSWTVMIAAYSQHGRSNEALELFHQMELKPDKVIFLCVLDACASLAALEKGKPIHAQILEGGFELDVAVGTALINMYGKCGSLDNAKRVFDKMPRRDVVCWTTLIAAYAQNGSGEEALKLFQRMNLQGVKPDKASFICVLDLCASLATLWQGKMIHADIVNTDLESDVVVGTALINMYGKCGCSDDAKTLFDKMPRRDVASWNAMIAAYAENGYGKEALAIFRQMDVEGVEPDNITFTNILYACSHTGLQDEGWHYLVSMSKDHGITSTIEHYGCMIDLVGRAGKLDEAEDLINNMPFQPDIVAWMTLLGACRIHGDVARGACAAKRILKMDVKNAAPYIWLLNMYAAAGRLDDVVKLRHAMEDRGVKKHPGSLVLRSRIGYMNLL